jgi:hypothetical protein
MKLHELCMMCFAAPADTATFARLNMLEPEWRQKKQVRQAGCTAL